MSSQPLFHTKVSEEREKKKDRQLQEVQNDVVIPKDPRKVCHLKKYSETTARLPLRWSHDPLIRARVQDHETQNVLEVNKVLNWCRVTQPLTAVRTIGDGNCFFYAVSIFIFGIFEHALLLRKLVYQSFVDSTDIIKMRWKRERVYLEESIPDGGLRLNSMDWDREWDKVVELSNFERQDAETAWMGLPYHSIEEIHIFMMANVLRRPIIIVAEPVMRSIEGSALAPNNCGGIYLPLLWEPKDCFKSPIVIGYNDNHFVPLLSQQDPLDIAYKAPSGEHAIPLVTNELGSLMIHFVTHEEEAVSFKLLTMYLRNTELVRTLADSVQTVPCARFTFIDLDEEVNVMGDLFPNFDNPMLRETHHRTENNLSHTERPSHLYGISKPEMRTQSPQPNPLNLSTDPEANMPRPIQQSSNARPATTHDPVNKLGRYPSFTTDCKTKNCNFFASKSTHPYCHECHRKLQRLNSGPYDKHSSLHRMPKGEDLMSPVGTNSLASHEEHMELKCIYQGCHMKGRKDMHDMCSTHFQATSPSSCLREGCEFMGLPEQDGFCSQCYKYNQHPEELTSMQIMEEVPRNPNQDLKYTQVFHKCKSPVCRAVGFETMQGYCNDCYIRGIRSKKIKRPPQPKISNITASESEAQKNICSLPGCEGRRGSNEWGMCDKCYDINRRRAMETEFAQASVSPRPPRNPEERKVQGSPSKKRVQIAPEVESIQLPVESLMYQAPPGGNVANQCIMTGCENPGYEATNNLCQECFNVLCDYHASKSSQQGRPIPPEEAPKEMVRPCRMKGCRMYGSEENMGYCSRCFMSVLYKDEDELPPNVDPLHAIEPILPEYRYKDKEYVARVAEEQRLEYVRKTKAKPCKNRSCTLYGDPVFSGYCSRCFDQNVTVVTTTTGVNNLFGSGYPYKVTNVYVTPRGAGRDVIDNKRPLPQSPRVTTAQSAVQIGNHNYMEINTDVHSTVKESTGPCRTPGCGNYGNARSRGYCNDCLRRK